MASNESDTESWMVEEGGLPWGWGTTAAWISGSEAWVRKLAAAKAENSLIGMLLSEDLVGVVSGMLDLYSPENSGCLIQACGIGQ